MHHWKKKKKKIQLERSSGQQLPHWKKKKNQLERSGQQLPH